MKRVFISAVAIMFSLSAQSHSQENSARDVPCGNNGTQAEANACTRRDYQNADAQMKEGYHRLMGELAGYGNKNQQRLRRAQASWLQYRDANCESESSIYQGGSIRPAVYYSCLASITRERTRRLAEFLATTKQ